MPTKWSLPRHENRLSRDCPQLVASGRRVRKRRVQGEEGRFRYFRPGTQVRPNRTVRLNDKINRTGYEACVDSRAKSRKALPHTGAPGGRHAYGACRLAPTESKTKSRRTEGFQMQIAGKHMGTSGYCWSWSNIIRTELFSEHTVCLLLHLHPFLRYSSIYRSCSVTY